jgi:selenocysteine lyase/cysteine desulfurase
VTGASNVTGLVNPIHRWASWAHEAGGRIVVDAAQLAPHRKVDMSGPERLDFVVFSGHKMYAPFGVGVLVGPRDAFQSAEPAEVGGGTVKIVGENRVLWAEAPEREEAGTPCVFGAVALAAAIREYRRVGWERMERHESRLTALALELLGAIPGVRIYGDHEPSRADRRLGVISFNVNGVPHGLVAAVLADEWAIGLRNGCFCAHPYVKALLGVGPTRARLLEDRVARGDRSAIPGAVRASIGIYNTTRDIELLAEAVAAVAEGRFAAGYVLDPARGEYAHPSRGQDLSRFLDAI